MRGRLGVAMAGAITAAAGPVPAGVYAIEPARTDVAFHLHLLGLFPVWGAFPGAVGDLRLDPLHPEASALAVRVPVAGVRASTRYFGAQLRSARWMDAADFPDMRFAARGIVFTAPDRAVVRGALTLHGVTRGLTLRVRLRDVAADPATHRVRTAFEAEGWLRRSDFGMSALLPVLSDEVRLTLRATFEKE